MAKTIIVVVSRRVPHPLYKRIINKRKKFYAHDEQGEAKKGDVVRIVESRPLSRLKRWTLGEVVRKAVQVAVEPSCARHYAGACQAGSFEEAEAGEISHDWDENHSRCRR
jgi:small subunit ribosomal protein S17